MASTKWISLTSTPHSDRYPVPTLAAHRKAFCVVVATHYGWAEDKPLWFCDRRKENTPFQEVGYSFGSLKHFLWCLRLNRGSMLQQEQRMSMKQKQGYDCPSAEVMTTGSTTMIFCHLHAFGQTTTIAWKMDAQKKLLGSALKHSA